MALYVDLSKVGSGDGSSGNPYSFNDWQSFLCSPSGPETLYMTGQYESVGPVLIEHPYYHMIYMGWNISSNGPWRLKCSNLTGFRNDGDYLKISDGILNITDTQTGYFITYNSYYIFGSAFNYNFIRSHGCIISCASMSGTNVDSYLQDTVLVTPSRTTTGLTLMGTAEYTSHTLPAWDAVQSAFDYNTLFGDIATPPQPGIGYPVYFNYTTDLWGNARVGIGTGFMAPYNPPVWASTYPKAGTIGGRTAEILVQTNETGMAYFVALPDGDTGPSAAQVKDGLNSVGVTGAVGMFGSVALDADTEASMGATGLTSETAYDIWVVANNSAGDLQAFATKINITTTDITPPSWEPTNPVTKSYGSTGADFTVGINETGTAYFVAVPDGETGPSSVQVKDGVNYAGVTGAEGQFGSISTLESGVTGLLSTTNLTPNTSYDVYFVAEDSSLNLQASPVMLDLTTQGPPVITVQPTPLTANEGVTGMLTLTATGDPAITSYQWYKNGSPMSNGGRVSGVTTNTLFITNLTMDDDAEYYAVVGNGLLPNTISSFAQITVTSTPYNILDLPGDISIHKFQIALTGNTFTENHRNIMIAYTGTASPSLTADLTTYEYSLDGITWEEMTPAIGTVVTDLSFTPTGEELSFEWTIKDDIGDDIYNKSIYIRFQATSDDMTTILINKTLYFGKVISNLITDYQNRPKLPEDYSGISGKDLLEKAPKVQ